MRIGFNSSQEGTEYEQPLEGEWEAVIGVIADVGIHKDVRGISKRKVVVGLELVARKAEEDDGAGGARVSWVPERDEKGRRFVLFRKYNATLWRANDGKKQSDLRSVLDGLKPGMVEAAEKAGTEVDTMAWVGCPCRVSVEWDAKGRADVTGILKPRAYKNASQAPRVERDYAQPFGLWSWLVKNADQGTVAP